MRQDRLWNKRRIFIQVSEHCPKHVISPIPIPLNEDLFVANRSAHLIKYWNLV